MAGGGGWSASHSKAVAGTSQYLLKHRYKMLPFADTEKAIPSVHASHFQCRAQLKIELACSYHPISKPGTRGKRPALASGSSAPASHLSEVDRAAIPLTAFVVRIIPNTDTVSPLGDFSK